MEGAQDSLLFPLFSIANDIHIPLEPTNQLQDPPNLNKLIQLQEDIKVFKKHIFEMSDQYYQWQVACILIVDQN